MSTITTTCKHCGKRFKPQRAGAQRRANRNAGAIQPVEVRSK